MYQWMMYSFIDIIKCSRGENHEYLLWLRSCVITSFTLQIDLRHGNTGSIYTDVLDSGGRPDYIIASIAAVMVASALIMVNSIVEILEKVSKNLTF